MVLRLLLKPSLLCGTALLCLTVFTLQSREAAAEPAETSDYPQAYSRSHSINAYRLRRIQARAESYAKRKEFPPSAEEGLQPIAPMVETKPSDPLKVVIPNVKQADFEKPRTPAIITRSAPAYAASAENSQKTGQVKKRADRPTPAPNRTYARPIMASIPVISYPLDMSLPGTMVSLASYKPNPSPKPIKLAASQEPVHSKAPDAVKKKEPAKTPPRTQAKAPAKSAAASPKKEIAKAAPKERKILPEKPLLLSALIPAAGSSKKEIKAGADNDVAESKKEPKTERAQNKEKKSAKVKNEEPQNAATAPKPEILKSPGIIIKREVVRLLPRNDAHAQASPQQLAALAPAAGPATDSEPLIQIPVPGTADQPPATEELKPLADPIPTPAPPPVAIPVPVPAPIDAGKIEEIVEDMDEAPVISEIPETPQSLPLPAVPGVAVTEPVKEPPTSLSENSKRILKTLPPLVDEKQKEPLGLAIDRSKDTSDAFEKEAATAEVGSPGIQIQTKTPPVNINYELEKAYSALLSGQSNQAISIYKSVLSYEPGNVDALFGLATTYHRVGQIDAARPLYGKILAKQPGHREALNNFLVLLADEAPEEAIAQLEAMEKKNPEFSPIPAQMAIIHQKSGDFAKAADKMYKAVALAPENLTYRYNLAILLDKQKNYEEAAKLYAQIIKAHDRGEVTPGNINKIQERLTFLLSNKR